MPLRSWLQTIVLASCAVGAGATVATAAAPANSVPPAVRQAIGDPARPAEDREADSRRRPAELLAFAGVRPGHTVVELLPGRGYFTRLLSASVGDRGRVYAVTPPRRDPGDADPAAALKPVVDEPRHGNVEVLVQRASQLQLPEQVDVVWTSLNYHDFHNVRGVPVADVNRRILAALKPGGTYVVIDHAAEPGSGLRDTSTRHRIDERAVIDEVTAAGFEFVGQSAVLRNPVDMHDLPVFDDRIRGRTDQFALKFRKPVQPKAAKTTP